MKQNSFKVYDQAWIIEQVYKSENVPDKEKMVSALNHMLQIEIYSNLMKENKFLAWDITKSEWQSNYRDGKIGSFVWDIACIINHANDSKYSEIFLENYLKHGGQKPSLAALYANLYYVSIFESLKKKDFGKIVAMTEKMKDDMVFDTDIISYESLLKLNITGY